MMLVRFPPGDPVLVGQPFSETLFAEIDNLLERGHCREGWLDMELSDTRLTCLIHNSRPFLAGLVEPERFTWVPLSDLVMRARSLEGAICSLYRSDLVRVLLMAVHFRNQPVLQATTRLVDLTHVLDVLAKDGQDASMVLERSGTRTIMFLQKGVPTRIYFGEPDQDPGGASIANRFLLYGFAPNAPVGKVEVFNQLNIEPDPDAGYPLSQLMQEAKPPPPMNVLAFQNERLELQRSFMPPYMIIGRDHTCELILNNPSVSRQHAKLSWNRGRFVIEDLSSANGTTLDGKRINRKILYPGDRIGVGIYEIVLAATAQAHDEKATMMLVPSGDDHPLYLTTKGQSIPLTSEITIGKTQGVDLRARGLFVRAVHARVRVEGSGVYRVICLGRASVRLNGKRVKNEFIRAGDELRVGRSRFQLVVIPNLEPPAPGDTGPQQTGSGSNESLPH